MKLYNKKIVTFDQTEYEKKTGQLYVEKRKLRKLVVYLQSYTNV